MTLRGCGCKKKRERELDHKTLFFFPSLLSLSLFLSFHTPVSSHFSKRKFLKRYLSKQIDTLAYYLPSIRTVIERETKSKRGLRRVGALNQTR